jgi:hypothetical protein
MEYGCSLHCVAPVAIGATATFGGQFGALISSFGFDTDLLPAFSLPFTETILHGG